MTPKKSLGQHFLTCGWVVDALLDAADIGPADTVVEIGPGTGVLTMPLAGRAGRVIAVEKDDVLAADLAQQSPPNVEVVHGDILSLVKPNFTRERSYKVVANIPYYLTSRLLRLLLEGEHKPERIVLTIQKEVAERITAIPPDMSILALSVQAYGTPRIVTSVPASCFDPRPDVDSAVITITDISDIFFKKNGVDTEFFFRIARTAFGQKRKQIINPLATIAGTKQKAAAALKAAGLDPRVRPQELSLDQWAALVTNLSQP